MTRTPKHLDPFAPEMTVIWQSGWGIGLHRTPVGVFFRLESGILYRAGRRGWWWRPTVRQALRKLARQAQLHSRVHPFEDEPEW